LGERFEPVAGKEFKVVALVDAFAVSFAGAVMDDAFWQGV
jgi:hypothetical protein